MKKPFVLLALLLAAGQIQAAPKAQIPAAFQGKWVEAGESCGEYENGETVRWWHIGKNEISQYRFGCTLDTIITAAPRQLRAKWRCEEVGDDDEAVKKTRPVETLTLSADGKRLSAFKSKYRFCGKP